MLTQRTFRSWQVIYISTFTLLTCFVCLQAWADSPNFGRKRIAQYSLDAQQLAAFQALSSSTADIGEPSVAPAEPRSASWIGPNLQVDRESGPYTVVVTLSARVNHDGAASTSWKLGWLVDGGIRTSVMPVLKKSKLKAGQNVVISKAMTPTRFKEQQIVALVLSLVEIENFEIQKLDVEIWSGIAEPSLPEIPVSLRWFLFALVALLLGYIWVRRS